MKAYRQRDLFAVARKSRATRRRPAGDKLITRRELRASLALYSPTGSGAVPDSGRIVLDIEPLASEATE
jgi:hypothetical protein